MEGTLWILTVFAAYFAVLIGIAILRARHMRGMTDYVLAGRRLGPVTSALSSASSRHQRLDDAGLARACVRCGDDALVDDSRHHIRRVARLDAIGETPAPLHHRHGRLPDHS